jgi:hypothetical protein
LIDPAMSTERKLCQAPDCTKPVRFRGNKYCGYHASFVLRQLQRSGYLTRADHRKFEDHRGCGAACTLSAWDNAVRALEGQG